MSHSTTSQLTLLKVCRICGDEKPQSGFYVRDTGRLRNECIDCLKLRNRRRYIAKRNEYIESANKWKEENPDAAREIWRRSSTKQRAKRMARDKVRAREAVRQAQRRGDLPHASERVCEICNEAQATEYHHYRGYAREHWLDVQALCRDCHNAQHPRDKKWKELGLV